MTIKRRELTMIKEIDEDKDEVKDDAMRERGLMQELDEDEDEEQTEVEDEEYPDSRKKELKVENCQGICQERGYQKWNKFQPLRECNVHHQDCLV